MNDRPTVSISSGQLLRALDRKDDGELVEALQTWSRRGGVTVEVNTPLILIVSGFGGRKRLTTLTRWKRRFPNVTWKYEPNTVGVTA